MDRIDGVGGVRGSLARVLAEIAAERAAQDELWGVQEFPDGTGPGYEAAAEASKAACGTAWSAGELTWRHILAEEFHEALAEADPERLRTELVQTAAVAVKWVQSLDRRHGAMAHHPKQHGGRHEKLVRDRIPEIMEAAGARAETRVAEAGEYVAFLRAKLYEEAGEYVASGEPEELADLLEVLHALAASHGMSVAELDRVRAEKAAERGGFGGKVLLHEPRHVGEVTPRVRHAVRAVLLDDDHSLVLFRRTKPGRDPYWTTPGGKVEPDDVNAEAALRRELDEELGATVGPLRQVFAYTEQTPGLHYLSTFYLCRLTSMDLSRRHGPEFSDPAKGTYDVEHVACTAEAIGDINLFPASLSTYLRSHAADLPALLP